MTFFRNQLLSPYGLHLDLWMHSTYVFIFKIRNINGSSVLIYIIIRLCLDEQDIYFGKETKQNRSITHYQKVRKKRQ